jgi:DNA mismatch endonuclease (patch repair protein)
MDTLSREQRHIVMSKIRSKNTKPELIIMRALKKRGIYFTKHRKDVLGKPDIVFKRKKIAVFIDSDFWHCNPERFRMPKSNVDFWSRKINRNIFRDYKVSETLTSSGWTVVRIWESDVLNNPDVCLGIILKTIGKHE